MRAGGQPCVRRAACWEREEGQKVTSTCLARNVDGWSPDTGHTAFLILPAMWDL